MDIPVAVASILLFLVILFVNIANAVDNTMNIVPTRENKMNIALGAVVSGIFILAILLVNILTVFRSRIGQPPIDARPVSRAFKATGAMIGYWIILSIPIFPLVYFFRPDLVVSKGLREAMRTRTPDLAVWLRLISIAALGLFIWVCFW